jgi:predicted nucleic acid-binding protein
VSGFLLDTNVLSQFSRSAIPPAPKVRHWMESANPDLLFASVLSVGEIRKGIELLPASKKRRDLEQWLSSDLYGWFGGNLLPVTKAISDGRGRFAARSQERGRPPGNIDGLLAATAFEHGLTVATHKAKHFEGPGVAILDPWEIRED